MNYDQENNEYRQIIGQRSDFYCVVTHPSLKKRSIRAMGIDAYYGGVEVTSFPPKWHQLLYVTHGKLTIRYGNKSKTATAGQIIIMPAKLERSLHSDIDCGWLWIHLKDVPIYSLLKSQGVDIQDCPQGNNIMKLYDLLREEPQGSVIESSYIEIISEKLIRLIVENKLRPYEAEFNTLWQKVREKPDVPWTIESMCNELKISRGHIHRLCISYFNSTPRDIINNIRLEYGAFLLRTSTKTIDSVSYKCGFSSARAFSKSFLKRYGLRPGKFRKQ